MALWDGHKGMLVRFYCLDIGRRLYSLIICCIKCKSNSFLGQHSPFKQIYQTQTTSFYLLVVT